MRCPGVDSETVTQSRTRKQTRAGWCSDLINLNKSHGRMFDVLTPGLPSESQSDHGWVAGNRSHQADLQTKETRQPETSDQRHGKSPESDVNLRWSMRPSTLCLADGCRRKPWELIVVSGFGAGQAGWAQARLPEPMAALRFTLPLIGPGATAAASRLGIEIKTRRGCCSLLRGVQNCLGETARLWQHVRLAAAANTGRSRGLPSHILRYGLSWTIS